LHRLQRPERPLRHQRREFLRRRAKPELEHDPESHPAIVRQLDDALGRCRGPLHRLFHQHMLAGFARCDHQLFACIRRREDQNRIHRRVRQHRLVARGDGEPVLRRESLELGLVAPVDATHRDAVRQRFERQRMRLARHSGAYDPNSEHAALLARADHAGVADWPQPRGEKTRQLK
jgi:hypothetical protein